MTQSWVINNQARSQPSEAMEYAVDNRRRIMGSSIFGGDTVIGENSTIGSNCYIKKSIAPNTIVRNKPYDLELKVKE